MKKPISVSNLTLDLWLGYVRPAAMTAGILEETTENDGTREYTTEIAPEAVADEVAHCMYCACMNSHISNNDYTKEGEAKQMLYQLSVSMKYDLHDTAEDVTKLYNALSAMLDPDRPTDSTHAEEETETEAAPAPFVISENPRFGSVEIKFSAKPDEATRDALKALKFRWNRKLGLWYGFATVEAVKKALEGGNTTEPEQDQQKPVKPATKPNKPDQDHIRIYWNGLKIDGGKLIGCYFHYDPSAETVCVSAKNYDDLPRDLFEVVNETDVYTDYFETDRATVDASHPLFPYLRYAALKEDARYAARNVERIEKRISGGDQRAEKIYAAELARDRARLEAFRAEKDPGQPTASDLAEIDRQRTEAENARREAEHRAELEERERVLRLRSEGRQYIESVNEKFPIRAGEPVVEIPFSENPAFFSWTESRDKVRMELIHNADGSTETKTIIEEPRRRLLLSVKAAEIVLDHFDKLKALEHRGYDKTDFVITWTEPGDTEESRYEGRYDLGDRDGGLIAHIRNLAQWYLTHDAFGHVKPDPETENAQTRLADWLETFCRPNQETA